MYSSRRCLLIQGPQTEAEDEKGRTALLQAVQSRHAGIVKLLVRHGAALHARDAYGASSLLLATRQDDEATVAALLEAQVTLQVLSDQELQVHILVHLCNIKMGIIVGQA